MVVNCKQLSCWRARTCGISSVRCAGVSGVQGQDLLLVASQDCTVSLWNLQGSLVGVMGKHTWTLSDPSTWQDPRVGVPSSRHSHSFGQASVQTCPESSSLGADAFMLLVILLLTRLCTLGHSQAVRCCHSASPCTKISQLP